MLPLILAITTQRMVGVLLSVTFVVMLLVVVKAKHVFDLQRRTESDKAGERGEQMASELISRVLRPDDRLFSNLVVNYQGKRTELDNVVVNSSGVFIIEVKNHSGRLEGNIGDFEWTKYHTSAAGLTYTKTVKNPIKQVKRQIFILAGYLREADINVYIRGYTLFLQQNCPVEDECVLESAEDVDNAIHIHVKKTMDPAKQAAICECLDQLPPLVF
ncbi:MAG: NERD domain-containing protein [Clostridia bacterium]|nr:NERD domain-containing protein [Clostridia bacterium]